MAMTSLRNVAAGFAAAITLTAFSSAFAEGPVLKGSQVTESAIVDALQIGAEPADANEPASRSLRPTLKSTANKPAGSGKANLLITFATGSAELAPEAVQSLEVVAKALKSDRLAKFTFLVEGHADPRGGQDYNMKLSEERAHSVVSYLTDKLGVPPDRLLSVGKGATDPINPSRPDAAENRRVTFVTVR